MTSYGTHFILILEILVDSVGAACPDYCNSCGIYNSCTSCKSGHWGLNIRCQHMCHEDCLNKECDTETGHCISCKPGFYGLQCQHNCSLCKDGFCDLEFCRYGCKAGYFKLTTGIEALCLSCPLSCRTCTSSSVCTVCNDGFQLYRYQKNYVKCIPCIDGDVCSRTCVMQNCKSCELVDNAFSCTKCMDGYMFNGEICSATTNTCSKGCSTDCRANGVCTGNCYAGWTGEMCSDSCAEKCLSCNRSNADICIECKGDYYTATCDVPCQKSCMKKTGKVTCTLNEGYCTNGCENKTWGPFCNKSCSVGCVKDGSSLVCENDNGFCQHGCIDGYTGERCDLMFSKTPVTQTVEKTTKANQGGITKAFVRKDDNTDVIIIGVGAGGGLVLLLLIIVLVLCFIKRRHNQDNPGDINEENQNMDNHLTNAENNLNENDYLYAQPKKPKKEQKCEEIQDYIYAQPSKPKKAKTQSRKEISEPQNLYDNIAIDLEEEQDTAEETNLDIIELETLDEGTISFVETEIEIPTSDTYYNTTDLIKSRIQVSDLLEYIKKKTYYETDFEKLPKGLTRTCNEALKPKNIAKNRFNGIYAYDATRVVLGSKNYVNANYIDGHTESPKYIASLGPTRATMNKFEAFWEMIWQDRIEKIVMLTHLKEAGKMKCEKYWPNQNGRQRYGGYYVACTAEMFYSEFVVREFNIKKGSELRQVTQYHFTAWPDKTVPDSVASLLEFRDKVEGTQTPNAGPMMVHCSAGIGRTGTYIALDILIKEGREKHYVDVFGCVTALRGQRAHMVQNLEQYIFLHHCVVYALTCDTQPLSVVTLQQHMTDDKIVSQYQSLKKLQKIQNNVLESIAINERSKDHSKETNIPGDNYKVKLTGSNHDSLNAVYVNGYVETNKFIISHTPSPKTVEEFVSMLYQEACPCVVCLDEGLENDKEVGEYIPPTNKVLKFGKFQVACRRSDSKEDYIIRELNISKIGSPSQNVNIQHYQYKGWKSVDTVPTNIPAFLNLITDVAKARTDHKTKHSIAVHCLKGSERGGIFCAVSIVQEKLLVQKEVSVINTVYHVCSRQKSAFDDLEKFRFCYNCVHEMQKIQEGNIYYNVVKP